MKFPLSCCVPTALLDHNTYDTFICKLVSDGYVNVSCVRGYMLASMWDYVGCNHFGDIILYDSPEFYKSLDDDQGWNNILNEEQLARCLSD